MGCPSGVDSECPDGQSCFAGHAVCETSSSSTPSTDPTTSPSGECEGPPCSVDSQCRSEWGHCGTTADHCNANSKWKKNGCGSSEATAQPSAAPTPVPSEATVAPTATPTASPTSAPTVPEAAQFF